MTAWSEGFGGLGQYTPETPPTPLGWIPLPITPVFTQGQDWIVTLEPSTTPVSPLWPMGTTITAYVYAATTQFWKPSSTWTPLFSWAATISGNNVYFDAPFADTDTVKAGSVMRLVVVFPSDGGTYVWAEGVIQRCDSFCSGSEV